MNLKEFLSSSGLSDYYATIAQDVESPAELVGYSHEELKNDFGIDKRAHRNRLLQAIAALSLDTKQESAAKGPSSCIIPVHLDALPAVIAFPLKEYCEESHPTMRLWAACDTIEMLLRFLVISAIAEQRQGGKLDPKLVRGLSGLIESPTLGAWYSMAVKLAKTAPKQSLMPEYADSVNGVLHKLLYGPENPGNPETSFLRLRNRLAHGGGLTRKEGTRLLALWQQRFESALQACSWLENLDLIGRGDDGAIVCLDGLAVPQPFELAEAVKLEESGSLWLVRGSSHCLLWPLAIFGQTMTEILGNSRKSDTYHAQIYSRKEAVRLTYTPFGAAGFHYSESGPDEMEAFERLFSVDTGERKSGFTIQDFNKELLRDAGQVVGRRRELDSIQEALASQHQGIWWLSGVAGMGKSFLMAELFAELKNQSLDSAELSIFAYRFRAGDRHRCNRDAFVTFLNERLRAAGILHEHFEPKKDGKTIERLEHCLKHIKQGQQVTVLLDGLDEITRSDPDFATEIPLAIEVPGIRLVLAGRPEERLTRAMAEKGAVPLFPDGLPPMSENDIRGMILDKIGPLRKALLGNDQEEKDELVSNSFISHVTECAAGLPLYVKYVIGDILAYKYRVFDANEPLPPSLDAYHEEMLRRLGVGSLQALLTPLSSLLALSREALSKPELKAMLIYLKALPDEPEGQALLDQGLAAIASMLKISPNAEGKRGYTLYHASLRDHFLQSPYVAPTIKICKTNLAELAECEDPPSGLHYYLLRNGIDHLLDAKGSDAAKKKLLDLNHFGSMVDAGVDLMRIYHWWILLGAENAAIGYLDQLNHYEFNLEQLKSEQPVTMLAGLSVIPIEGLETDSVATGAELNNIKKLIDFCYEFNWLTLGTPFAEFYYEILQVSKEYLDPTNFEALRQLGNFLRRCERYPEAEKLLRQCLDLLERIYGTEHFETLATMATLGNLLSSVRNYSEAEKLLRQCLDLSKKIRGNEDISTLAIMENLGSTLADMGKYAESEDVLRLCLKLHKRNLGEEDANTLIVKQRLGSLLLLTRKYTEAEELLRQCLDFRTKSLGKEHPNTLLTMSQLGLMFYDMKKYSEAEQLLRQCLESRRKILGDEHPDTLNTMENLVEALISLKKYSEAETLLRQCLDSLKSVFGHQHLHTIATMNNLGVFLCNMRKYVEAEELLRDCLCMHKKSLGKEHVNTLAAMHSLGKLLQRTHKYSEAEKLLCQCLESCRKTLGDEHPMTLDLIRESGSVEVFRKIKQRH